MSEFDDYYDAWAGPTLQARAGDPVTYIDPDDGTETAPTALLGPETIEEDLLDAGRSLRRTRSITLFKSDVASVSMRATVRIGTEVWSIEAKEGESASQTAVRLVRKESAERSRPGYRKKD